MIQRSRHGSIRGAVAASVYGTGTAPGTFGELLQGILSSRDDFLVSLPIDLRSEAEFEADSESDCVVVDPPHKTKSVEMAERVLRHLGRPVAGRLTIRSGLPEGKGMASSSADLVATAHAVAACYGISLSPATIADLIRGIEPTDGVMYSGLTSFLHRTVRVHRELGALPALSIVGVDEGGVIDTVSFNESRPEIPSRLAGRYERLLERLACAVGVRDLVSVGRVATESAVIFQHFNPKRYLDDVRAICADVGGLGTVTTHSGTCVGVLLDPADPAYSDRLAAAKGALRMLQGELVVCRTPN